MPSKVQLEVMLDNKLVDVVDLVVPGSHVKTLTSSSRLIREYQFSRKMYNINLRKKYHINLDKSEDLYSPEEKDFKKELEKITNT